MNNGLKSSLFIEKMSLIANSAVICALYYIGKENNGLRPYYLVIVGYFFLRNIYMNRALEILIDEISPFVEMY